MSATKPLHTRHMLTLGFSLIWTAGFVDAVGFITLHEVYVANMSGNTVSVALHAAGRDWVEAWAHFCPILAFVPGLIAGNTIIEIFRRQNFRRPLIPAMLIEVAALILFLFIAASPASESLANQGHRTAVFAILAILLAFSMGLQNGALGRVGALQDVHTYVTGTLLAAANSFTRYLFWLQSRLRYLKWPVLRRAFIYSPHHRAFRKAAFAAGLWIFYIIGATVAAILQARHAGHIILIPIAILLLLTIFHVLAAD
jgi:uncharacterized membrane protein YoaK (UPF0700 family)